MLLIIEARLGVSRGISAQDLSMGSSLLQKLFINLFATSDVPILIHKVRLHRVLLWTRVICLTTGLFTLIVIVSASAYFRFEFCTVFNLDIQSEGVFQDQIQHTEIAASRGYRDIIDMLRQYS